MEWFVANANHTTGASPVSKNGIRIRNVFLKVKLFCFIHIITRYPKYTIAMIVTGVVKKVE
jgi:hypothetical protein